MPIPEAIAAKKQQPTKMDPRTTLQLKATTYLSGPRAVVITMSNQEKWMAEEDYKDKSGPLAWASLSSSTCSSCGVGTEMSSQGFPR